MKKLHHYAVFVEKDGKMIPAGSVRVSSDAQARRLARQQHLGRKIAVYRV